MSNEELKLLIWRSVASIPKGKVASYGQVARQAGLINYARYVGTTLKNLPDDTSLPWHRVVRANGELAFATESTKWLEQSKRLAQEGVELVSGRVPMTLYAWQA